VNIRFSGQTDEMFIIVAASAVGASFRTLDESLADAAEPCELPLAELPTAVAVLELTQPRWVWDDTRHWYPRLLAARVRVDRCIDLRLSHAILRNSALTAESRLATEPRSSWDEAAPDSVDVVDGALFDFDRALDVTPEHSYAEFLAQREAIAGSTNSARIGLLLAAESAGSLVAAEIFHAGLPWRADRHNAILESVLGPRPPVGHRPVRLHLILAQVRIGLNAPDLNPDSPVELLAALRRAGVPARTTRSAELRNFEHPAISPLLEYKKLARLLSANGWNWLDANVSGGRFYPDYVPGGVVTGRWASKGGGGALQVPKQVRSAVVADDGWKFVVADASQLEPRILAALAGDSKMAAAGAAGDLYAGIVASGAVSTRGEAKLAMLGAMYGATTGESGRLLPALSRAFPRAIGFVEAAARAGEKGAVVTTRLGRSSPLPGVLWWVAQSDADGERAPADANATARGHARRWGRFTRNFVVQGSAAEWALCWMAHLRGALYVLGDGHWITDSPHLVFFMHDEVVVHCRADDAAAVERAIRSAAVEAGRLMFGEMPVTFPLTVAVVDNYGEAK